MPLYDNVLGKQDSKDPGKTPIQSASMKLLQEHLAAKRRLQQQKKPSTTKQSVIDSKHDPSYKKDIIHESALHRPREVSWDSDEEYDPMVPNSYEILQAERIKADEMRLAASRSSIKKPIANLLDVIDKLDDVDYLSTDRIATSSKGISIAPPPSLASVSQPSTNSEANGSMSSKNTVRFTLPLDKGESTSSGSVAAKIMSKMGYKPGQGLGKDEQGISAPLEVEKSSINVGRILPAQMPTAPTETTSSSQSMAKLLKDSTRVILLQNMVGPGEVDDDLQGETMEECRKYGEVLKCLIYEIPNKRVPDDQAVRIFVEFKSVESAIKAVGDLNGRYFGGRVVRATFYSADKFNRYELAPQD